MTSLTAKPAEVAHDAKATSSVDPTTMTPQTTSQHFNLKMMDDNDDAELLIVHTNDDKKKQKTFYDDNDNSDGIGINEYWIYHERQESLLCGKHALNNLLQVSDDDDNSFTVVSLQQIAERLDQIERELLGEDVTEEEEEKARTISAPFNYFGIGIGNGDSSNKSNN